MEEMKELRKNDPKTWHFAKLGHKYGISALAASKIITSRFSPTPHQRVTRWLEREEFKQIQGKVLRSIAKEERAKIIEDDLKSRYGRLYTPPEKKIRDPFINKLVYPENNVFKEVENEDEEDDENISISLEENHLTDIRHGGLISLYRRITAEAKAVVASKLEIDLSYQKAFARDVNRIQREEQLKLEEKKFLDKEEEKPKREFFNIFDGEEFKKPSRIRKLPQSFKSLKDTPWRQKHITSRKSTRIKHWPKDILPNRKDSRTFEKE